MRYLPNILSVLRIFMIPFFVSEMLKGNTTTAAAILAASGFTDLLDGFIARKFNAITDLGKVLDPVADKLTQATVCLVLAYILKQYIFFFAIMLLKEVAMIGLGGYLLKKGAHIDGAKWFGKMATVLFYITMILIVLIPSMPQELVLVMLGVTTAFVVFAFARYIPMFFTLKSNAATIGKERKN